jgi:putative transposase
MAAQVARQIGSQKSPGGAPQALFSFCGWIVSNRPNYNLVPMAKRQLSALHHCIFSLRYHLVLVTKYRRKVMTKEMIERSETIFRETLEKWDSELIEFKAREDYAHLVFETNPTVQLSRLVNNLKTVSSRLIRRDFREQVDQFYGGRVFWHRSYCLMTMGRATSERLRKYIEEQGYDE